MKKLLTILLALSLTAVAAVSCGKISEEETESKPDTKVDASDDNNSVTPDDDKIVAPDDEVEAPNDDEEFVEDEIPAADPDSAAGIIDRIYEIKAPEFMYGTFPDEVVLADNDSIKYYTGLDSLDGVADVAVSESMMGSQAYSLVVVKVEDASNAKNIAEAMKNGIDQRKWCCVEADDIIVSGAGDTVMLIMIDSEYKDSISVTDINEAFKSVCGGKLDFEI